MQFIQFTLIALLLVATTTTTTSNSVSYKYSYGVEDPFTKDSKSAWEHSDGYGAVIGGYKFSEADGTHRNVEYISDGKGGGTSTIVERVGHAFHPDVHGEYDGKASSYANYMQFPHEYELQPEE